MVGSREIDCYFAVLSDSEALSSQISLESVRCWPSPAVQSDQLFACLGAKLGNALLLDFVFEAASVALAPCLRRRVDHSC